MMRSRRWWTALLACLGISWGAGSGLGEQQGPAVVPPAVQETVTAPAAAPATAGCLASGCHQDYKQKFTHLPAEDASCLKCHKVTDEKKHAVATVVDEPQLCTRCHPGTLKNLAFQHGPVAAGACTVCHDPHGSPHSGLLLEETNTLCYGCHEEMQERMEKSSFKHSPVEDDCTACHNAHGGANRMNLNGSPPDLCTECHDTIAESMGARVGHDAVKTGRACLNCHDAHASNFDKGLLADPMKLCLGCHDKQLETPTGKLTDIKSLLGANPEHHGPIQQESCSECHSEIHGSNNFRLLMAAYPQKFYSPFDPKLYDLCFQCHEPDLVKDAETTELTGFRNGKQNLHFVHVNRSKKGRTCRACHETHASKKPFHIRESVPFGKRGWELPIKYVKTPKGGACSPGCHKKYSYDREKAIQNIKKSRPTSGG